MTVIFSKKDVENDDYMGRLMPYEKQTLYRADMVYIDNGDGTLECIKNRRTGVTGTLTKEVFFNFEIKKSTNEI